VAERFGVDVPGKQRFDILDGCGARQVGKDVAQIGVGFEHPRWFDGLTILEGIEEKGFSPHIS
jgi:hypothetical protein